MVLNVKGIFSSNNSFLLSLNGERKTLSNVTSEINFQLVNQGIYTIEIAPTKSCFSYKILSFIIYCITIFIQGICNIFLMNISNKWYEDVCPYFIKVKIKVCVTDDCNIIVYYTSSQYDDSTKKWRKPELRVDGGDIIEMLIVNNSIDFKVQYLNYVKRIFSIFCVAIAFFGYLLYIAIITSNMLAGSIILICIVFIFSIIFYLIISQYKKMKNYYTQFNELFISSKNQ